MKAVVLENEYAVPALLKRFIAQYMTTLFDEVRVEIGVRHRPLSDVGKSILWADAILLESTFVYMDQVHSLLEAFLIGPLNIRTYRFYAVDITSYLNTWLRTDRGVARMVLQLMDTSEVYNVYKHIDPDRGMTYTRVYYSLGFNVFYEEGDYPQTIKNGLR